MSEGLDFIPLAEERFELGVPEGHLAAGSLELIEGSAWRTEVRRFSGCDQSIAGHAFAVATHGSDR